MVANGGIRPEVVIPIVCDTLHLDTPREVIVYIGCGGKGGASIECFEYFVPVVYVKYTRIHSTY